MKDRKCLAVTRKVDEAKVMQPCLGPGCLLTSPRPLQE
jgi:hypothetical protein